MNITSFSCYRCKKHFHALKCSFVKIQCRICGNDHGLCEKCMKPEDFCNTCLGFTACKENVEPTCFLCKKDFCCIPEKKKETCDCFGANGVASFCEKCASSPKL